MPDESDALAVAQKLRTAKADLRRHAPALTPTTAADLLSPGFAPGSRAIDTATGEEVIILGRTSIHTTVPAPRRLTPRGDLDSET